MFNELTQFIRKYEGYIAGIGDLGLEAIELLLIRDKIESYLNQPDQPIPIQLLGEITQLDILLKKRPEAFAREFSSEEITHFQQTIQKPPTHWWWHVCLASCVLSDQPSETSKIHQHGT